MEAAINLFYLIRKIPACVPELNSGIIGPCVGLPATHQGPITSFTVTMHSCSLNADKPFHVEECRQKYCMIKVGVTFYRLVLVPGVGYLFKSVM